MNTILVVGNSYEINTRLEELLNEHKAIYKTKTVTDLDAALKVIEKEPPAIILMNNNLPENDGLSLIHHKAVQNGTSKLVILDNDAANKELLLKIGAVHVIDIYHDFDKLPALVAKLISSNTNNRP